MIKKNPKKNYSLKGKPLSTKIAFVVICIFIFSLFVGSFGGLIYLGRSCSNFVTVSAEGLDGTGSSTTTTVENYASLNLSGVHYEVYGPTYAGGLEIAPYIEFMFFLPITVRSVTTGSASFVYFDYQYWDTFNNTTESEYFDFGELSPGDSYEFNCGVMDIHDTVNFNIGLRLTASTVLSEEFSTLSTVKLSFYGNDLTRRGINLELYDVDGNYREYGIYPLYSQGSRGFFLNSRTGYSNTFVYSLSPFNLDSLSNSYNRGYQDAIRDTSFLNSEYYDQGYADGLARGKILGAADAGDYTFASLLDAVFYAPVKMFVSLFNFDFLGINVLSLATTLLTIVVAFGIIKFFV